MVDHLQGGFERIEFERAAKHADFNRICIRKVDRRIAPGTGILRVVHLLGRGEADTIPCRPAVHLGLRAAAEPQQLRPELFDEVKQAGNRGFLLFISINLDYEDPSSEVWMDTIQGWLAEGKPVMVCWNDWGGHWQVIIGYDTMGTETQQDDVFIVADPYDTTDHCQDGYGVLMAERFLYNFSMYGAFPEEEGGSDFLFLVASPAE